MWSFSYDLIGLLKGKMLFSLKLLCKYRPVHNWMVQEYTSCSGAGNINPATMGMLLWDLKGPFIRGNFDRSWTQREYRVRKSTEYLHISDLKAHWKSLSSLITLMELKNVQILRTMRVQGKDDLWYIGIYWRTF